MTDLLGNEPPATTRRTRTARKVDASTDLAGGGAGAERTQVPAPIAPAPTNVFELIAQGIKTPGGLTGEQLHVLLDFQLRVEAHQAEIDFNAAKGRILEKLADIKIVKKKKVEFEIEKGTPKKGFYEAYRYAPLEEIDKRLGPLLAEERMDLSFSDEPREGGGILVRGRLKHLPGGHYEDSFMPAPLDTSGGKNNVQGMGSTNNYLRRYITCNIFNIVVVGEDDDGLGGYLDFEQVRKIRSILTRLHKADERRGNEENFIKVMRTKSLEELPQRRFREAMSKLAEQALPLGIEVDGDLS